MVDLRRNLFSKGSSNQNRFLDNCSLKKGKSPAKIMKKKYQKISFISEDYQFRGGHFVEYSNRKPQFRLICVSRNGADKRR